MTDKRRLTALVLVAASAVAVAGCPGKKPVDPSPVLTSVSITGAPAGLTPPQTASLRATANYSNSTTQDVTASSTWSSDNQGVATVSAGGEVRAVAIGTARIAATFLSVQGSVPVMVRAAELRANPGGPYMTRHDTNIVFSGLTSTSMPFQIVRYEWNCGQSVAANCVQQGAIPTPTFNYRKCGVSGRPSCRAGSTNVADYTVTLTVEDAQGNRHTAATTVAVTNNY